MRSCGKVEIKHVVDTDTSGQKGDGLFHELLALESRKWEGVRPSNCFQWRSAVSPAKRLAGLGALPSEGRGHRFESCRVRQTFQGVRLVSNVTFEGLASA